MEAPVQSWAGTFFMKATNFQERIYRVARVVLHYRGDEKEACKLRYKPDGFAKQNGRGAERADTLTL